MLPSLELPSSRGQVANLASLGRSSSLIVCVAGTSAAGPNDVDTARAHAWQPYGLELAALGYKLAWVSACLANVQQEWAVREGLRYPVLSDTGLELARVLGLPTRETFAGRVYQNLTLIAHEDEITQVFCPVGPQPDATDVVGWISRVHV